MGEAATDRANPPVARLLLVAGAGAPRDAFEFLPRTSSGSAADDCCVLTKGVVSGSSLDGPITCGLDETEQSQDAVRKHEVA
jgi:hypothetical protein